MKKYCILWVFNLVLGQVLVSQINYPMTEQQKVNRDIYISELLSRMTISEKVGQMNQYSGFYDPTGPAPQDSSAKIKYDHIKQGLVGAMLNVRGAKEVRALQQLAVEESRLGIPMLFGFDVIHGFKTITPIPLAEAASWDLAYIKASAQMAAEEASAAGVNWTFAPMVDINRDARWGRVMEGAGEDPYLGSVIAQARVTGFQGEDLSEPNTLAACAKHFAGYGFVESGKEYNQVDIGLNTLYNMVLPPFKACVDADVQSFMNSFTQLNGVPATGDSFLQREILKGKWAFNGFVVSDWASIAEMVTHNVATDKAQAGLLAAEAGCDMDMEGHAYIAHLENLHASGRLDEAVIDDAVRRILLVKYNVGLFEDPYRYCDEIREKQVIGQDSHLKLAQEIAERSIVLLKNDEDILPLKENGQKIAVIGQLAHDKNSPLGNWRLAADNNSAISLYEGLQQYDGNEYKYEQGVALFSGQEHFVMPLKINEEDTSGIQAAIDLAAASDLVILNLGEHGLQSGEGRSRARLDLPGLQQELLEAVYAVNPNIILVLQNGRPLAIPWADEHIPAIVECWQLGTQSGHAIASVLYGDYNPSGKLPMSFPRSVGQVPIYYNNKSSGRPGPGNDVFWTHYNDEDNAPLYPFGFGLSYTDFTYTDLIVRKTGEYTVEVSVQLLNVGHRSGEEVVQLYLRDQVASVARPLRELKGFEKIALHPGEEKRVIFTLDKSHLGFFNNKGEYIVENGKFTVMIDSLSEEFSL